MILCDVNPADGVVAEGLGTKLEKQLKNEVKHRILLEALRE